MRSQCSTLLLLAGLFIGCTGSISTVSNPVVPIIGQEIVPGGECEIMLGKSDGTQISYVGRVAEVANDSVTLNDVLKRVRVTKSPAIPLVGKMFKTTSIGGEKLDGPVTIRRDEIAEILDTSAQ